jgi:phosphoesterase RecJ-like protein
MNQKMTLNKIAAILKDKTSFLLLTHKDADADGIGSMLALGKALLNDKKEVVSLTEEPVNSPVSLLKGYDRIVREVDVETDFDVVITLDCGDKDRVGAPHKYIEGSVLIVNIDHHESHHPFGDFNLVDSGSSSTGELVYRVIKECGLPIDFEMAENIFAAIQADTGSFKYENTTSQSFRIAAEMMDYGVEPSRISLLMTDDYSLSGMRLLEMALGAVEFYYEGKLGMLIVSSEMLEKARAQWEDSEKFVDYIRHVSGVELAVLVRETGRDIYKFSMRSNRKVNVAKLATMFGGGGHARAAGFECHNAIGAVKNNFLKETGRFLGDISN